MEKWRQDLITNNIALVKFIAKKLKFKIREDLNYEEMVSMGTVGLNQAAAKYDPKMGYKFSTYAYYRIQGAIYDGLRKTKWGEYIKAQRAFKTREAANSYLGSKATANSKVKGQKNAFKALAENLSGLRAVFVMCDEDNAATQTPKSIPDDSTFDHHYKNQLRTIISKYLDQLKPNHRLILEDYYYNDKSFKEISRERNKTYAWAWSSHARAMEILREKLDKEDLLF